MKNFYKDGDTLPLTMTQNVLSGQLVRVGQFVGVCANDCTTGNVTEVALEGVYSIPKNSADVIVQGQALKFVPATGVIDATSGTVEAGVAAQAAAAGTATVYVRLTQGFGMTPAMAMTETAPAEHPVQHEGKTKRA